VTMVVMLLLLGLGGVLLTALAYRPKEQREDWWQWTERFTRSESSRVAGPVLVAASLITNLAGLACCLTRRYRRTRPGHDSSPEVRSLDSEAEVSADQACLLSPAPADIADIACFPDGSLRSKANLCIEWRYTVYFQ